MAKEGREDKRGQEQGQAEEEEDLLAELIERLARELLALPASAWGDEDEDKG